jgi:hypothetical protein
MKEEEKNKKKMTVRMTKMMRTKKKMNKKIIIENAYISNIFSSNIPLNLIQSIYHNHTHSRLEIWG